jgi:hypothetical protein
MTTSPIATHGEERDDASRRRTEELGRVNEILTERDDCRDGRRRSWPDPIQTCGSSHASRGTIFKSRFVRSAFMLNYSSIAITPGWTMTRAG